MLKYAFYLGLLLSSAAFANPTHIVGAVTDLEATYMPGTIAFKLSAGDSNCPTGTTLKWQSSSTETNKAVYTLLLTAISTGKSIGFWYNETAPVGSRCVGTFIHMIK